MKLLRAALGLASVLLIGSAPRPSPDARLRTLASAVSQAQLRHTIQTLVNFGTRHTLSSQTDPKRGIGAAVAWALEEFGHDSAACGQCLRLARPGEVFSGDRLPAPTPVFDAVAIQWGSERPNEVVIIQGHIDSRVTDVMNATSDAPGANDDASGVAAVMEAARILSKHKFPGTIVYAALSGEEQGLYGGTVLADYAKAAGLNVVAVLNNDIIGNSCSSDGVCDSTHARVLSEGPRSQGEAELAKSTHSLGGENDSPSRNISRYLDGLADRLNIGLDVRQIWRTDRFGRGGDHIPFLGAGYPAARISVAVENYNWQHQDLRTEKGIRYGDTIDHVDFAYLAKVTKLNVAALASIASAPPPPEPTVEGAVSTDTTLTWDIDAAGVDRYVIRWRRTDSNQWERSRIVSTTGHANCSLSSHGSNDPNEKMIGGNSIMGGWTIRHCKAVLPHIRVDDWVFGVSSVSKDGFESPVASAVPGGAFKPWSPSPAKK